MLDHRSQTYEGCDKLTVQAKLADRPTGRRERHRAETRDRIVRHALRLFSERGVSATTIEDITEAADVGKGTFFNYFPSKEHILAYICQLQMGKIRELVAQAIQSTEPLESVMYRLALTVTEDFARSPCWFKACWYRLCQASQCATKWRMIFERIV